MFTGLVDGLGVLTDLRPNSGGARLTVSCPGYFANVDIGASVAVNGCCLTVVERRDDVAEFDAIPETLSRTSLGMTPIGEPVNLERSLQVGDSVGGHFVTGHVDCVGHLARRLTENQWSTYWIEIPAAFSEHVASKGSIAIDGVSLTVVDVDAHQFSVALIPHTLEVTTLGRRRVGDAVNVETDLLAKYVRRLLKAGGNASQAAATR